MPHVKSHLLILFLLVLSLSTRAKLDVVSMDVSSNGETSKPKTSEPKIVRKDHVDDPHIRLAEALRNLDDGQREVDLKDPAAGISPERLKEVQEVFDYLDSQVSPDDATMIRFSVQRLTNGTSSTDKDVIVEMQVLQSYLDQVDNAVDFCEAFNGISLLKTLFVNYSATDVRIEIIRTVGIASQNNPRVIEKVLEEGFLESILKELSSSSKNDCAYVARLIHTLSALTRQNDDGLRRLGELNGSVVLEEVVTKFDGKSGCDNVIPKVMDFVADVTSLNVDDRNMFRSDVWCSLMSGGLRSSEYSKQESSLRYFEKALSESCLEQRTEIEGNLRWIKDQFDKKKLETDVEDELEFDREHAQRASVLLEKRS